MCWRNPCCCRCGCGPQNGGCGRQGGGGCGCQNGGSAGIGNGQNLRCGWFRICAAPFATTLADTALNFEQEEFGCGRG